MNASEFGRMPNGDPVLEVELRSGAFTANVISWGAVLRDLRMNLGSEIRPLVLGFEQLVHYLQFSRNHGANVGRYGGRSRSTLEIDGCKFSLSANLNGRNHLHGGFLGLGRRNWHFVEATQTSVVLEIASPEGDEGYPGDLVLRSCYTLHSWGLSVQLTATTSAPTPVNILHHSYFNLDGKGEIAGHVLQIEGNTYLEFDAEGLPTGRRLSVAGSAFDFSSPRKLVPHERFDTSFVVSPEPLAHPAHVAMLLSSAGDLRMNVRTTEPGLHFYNGYAAAAPVPGLEGRPHLPSSGICLEATRFNDAFNLPHLADVILRPGRTYHQRTEFAFDTVVV